MNPLFLVLMKALESDVEFLASKHIIDYSLLVGIDWDRKILSVGLIDFIRTFTWDKYWEWKLKATVGGATPTIINPANYKKRFIDAMTQYFHVSPDSLDDDNVFTYRL